MAFFFSFKKLLLKGGAGHLYPFAVKKKINRKKKLTFIKRRNVIKLKKDETEKKYNW